MEGTIVESKGKARGEAEKPSSKFHLERKHRRKSSSSSRSSHDHKRNNKRQRSRSHDKHKKDKHRDQRGHHDRDRREDRDRKHDDSGRRHHHEREERRKKSTSRDKEKRKDLEEKKDAIKSEKKVDSLPTKRPEDFEQGTMRDPTQQKGAMLPARAGGVYIPPFKMRAMLEELKNKEKTSLEHQKYMWEMLRKSINGIVNKVNTSNIQNIILELFNENLLRGKGLLSRAIMKAQMASPNFTHVYAALVAVINTKLPAIVKLLIERILIQFQRSYQRNNKLVCIATTKMLAHLVNQQVVHELLALELLTLFLENPTEDSVEIAADFMIECGQVLSDITPAGVNAIFERFRTILHEGEIDKKVQYTIENLFAIRKTKFAEHPGVIPELDLVEEEDKITHTISLDDQFDGQDSCNFFQFDPNYEQTEAEWDEIKKEILGEEAERINQQAGLVRAQGEDSSEEEEEDKNNQIFDFTEKDLVNLRRTIYLVIMSSVDFEECAHKLLKLNIREGQEMELCNMIFECCMQERTYLRFHGLLAQRFCQINEIYQQKFHELFMKQYQVVHRLEINKLRNGAKFLAHLLYTDAIEWSCLQVIRLTEEDTTASSRIFIKIVFQELAENLGIDTLVKKLKDESVTPFLQGIFPSDSVQNARFSINFFTSIGLGAITEDLREFIKNAPKLLIEKKLAELMAQANQSSSDDSSSSDSDSDSGSSSSSSGSASSSESDKKRKKRK